MTRHSLQIIDQALSPLRSIVLAFKVLRDLAANSLPLPYLSWLTNTLGCLGIPSGCLVLGSALGSSLTPLSTLQCYLPHSYPRISELETHSLLIFLMERGSERGMNFSSAQGELMMGPNLLPIKITTSHKIANMH